MIYLNYSATVFLSFLILSCTQSNEDFVKPLTLVIVQEAKEKKNLGNSSGIQKPILNNDWVIADNAGWVVERLKKNGESVKAGQTILRLDPRDIRLSDSAARTQFEAAKARLKAQQLDFERFNELNEKKFISQAEWERRKAQLAVQSADFERLADNLGVVSIRSSVDGVIQNVDSVVGDFVKTGEKVAKIVIKGKRNSRNNWTNKKNKNAFSEGIKIPLTSLIDGEYVFLVLPFKNEEKKRIGRGTIKKIEVKTNYIDERIAILTNGLNEGDIFIVTGGSLLTEGQEVRFSY